MRYTQYRGLAQVSNWVKLKFAAMNLKKLARWLWQVKLSLLHLHFSFFGLYSTETRLCLTHRRVSRQTEGRLS